MKDGFLSVAAVNFKTKTIEDNVNSIIALSKEAAQKAKIIVFPKLSITGADQRDLYLHEEVLLGARNGLLKIASETAELDALIVCGLPVTRDGSVFDCAAVINKGSILGVIPQRNLESSCKRDDRPFMPGDGARVFVHESLQEISIGIASGKDINFEGTFMGYRPLIVINPTADMEFAGRSGILKRDILSYANRNHCGVISVNAGPGEGSTDGIYAGGSIICDNEKVVAGLDKYEESISYGVIDITKLLAARRMDSGFNNFGNTIPELTGFKLEVTDTNIAGVFSPYPFFPEDEDEKREYCLEILDIQKHALINRMKHIGLKKVVLGVSGGLDSTLALLVSREAMDTLGYPASNIIAITLPGFGTTGRTYDNAVGMIKSIGADFREISIVEGVKVHFKDINHPEDKYDLTFENAQARERTQILMDVAGMEDALMVGTGDLSELGLGWCTYNGDHMSMYAVNGGVSKTLIREVVKIYAQREGECELSKHLLDVVATPISPELLPSKSGKTDQKTEDKVGPYELSDFFLYHTLKGGYTRAKLRRMTISAFAGEYSEEEIDKWMDVFYRRFTSQAFKRSCMPDGPGVMGLSLSPRLGFRMTSDTGISFT